MTRRSDTQRRVDPELSAKRREAGRQGAAARWNRAAGERPKPHTTWSEGLRTWRASRPDDALRYRVDNRAGDSDGVAEMWIYDEIDPWWGTGAAAIVDELRQITADRIQLHINSPGGDVFEAHAIYNALRNHSAEVDVLIDGLAASAAAYIAMAGDTVTIASNSMMMIHDAIGLTYGNSADHVDVAARLDKISDGIATLYAERAGGTVEEWRDAMRDETWYDATEAVDAGLADEVSGGTQDTAKNITDTRLYAEAAALVPGRTDTPSGPAGDPDTDSDVLDGVDLSSITEALEGAFA